MKDKIFVGISGGVDSSVVAYLLKKQGYDVHGIFVKTWSPEWIPCTWINEKRDAMRVCATLNIPFHFLDAEDEYKNGVANYMIEEYRKGRTPNPDVFCNRIIKFGAMWEYAKNQGAKAIATGHYARINNSKLLTGLDKNKDQSYFLWMIKSEELRHILFPIGHLEKREVRKIAEKINLFTNNKKDSQGICFLGDIDMRDFLSHYIEQKKGNVLNENNEIIGHHDGVCFYTIGERHGFHIIKKGTNDKPYYVLSKDINNNTLMVSQNKNNKDISDVQNIKLREVNWIEKYDIGKKYKSQIRYRGSFLETDIIDNNHVILKINERISLGQSLVIYDGDILVGGGIIDVVY